MEKIGILEEFFHRKSDGIGMSDRFPKMAQTLEAIMDLLPAGMNDFDEAAVSRVAGRAVQKGLSVADMANSAMSDGPVKFLAEQARDKMIESDYGKDAVTAVKEVMKPGSGVLDRVKDPVFVAVGVAVTLGVYDLMIRASNGYHSLDHIWHVKNGVDMGEGSDLHKWAGGEARQQDMRSLMDRQNPFGGPVTNPFAAFSKEPDIQNPEQDDLDP